MNKIAQLGAEFYSRGSSTNNYKMQEATSLFWRHSVMGGSFKTPATRVSNHLTHCSVVPQCKLTLLYPSVYLERH